MVICVALNTVPLLWILSLTEHLHFHYHTLKSKCPGMFIVFCLVYVQAVKKLRRIGKYILLFVDKNLIKDKKKS